MEFDERSGLHINSPTDEEARRLQVETVTFRVFLNFENDDDHSFINKLFPPATSDSNSTCLNRDGQVFFDVSVSLNCPRSRSLVTWLAKISQSGASTTSTRTWGVRIVWVLSAKTFRKLHTSFFWLARKEYQKMTFLVMVSYNMFRHWKRSNRSESQLQQVCTPSQ